MPLGALFKLSHQRPGCLVAHNGKKVSLGWHRDGHTGRDLLRAGLAPGEPDTFQDDRTGQRAALGFQAGHERLTPQSILLFETECHEPDRPRERSARGGAKPLQGEPRAHSHYHPRPVTQIRCHNGPRSGAGATLPLVLAGPDTWLPPHCDRPCPTHYELAAGGPPGLGKLRRQIVRRLPERARTGLRMPLADEGLKMAVDSEALVHHNKTDRIN